MLQTSTPVIAAARRLTVAKAITAHRRALAAFEAVCQPIDEVWREEVGLDTSPKAMRGPWRAWNYANRREAKAWLAVVTAEPASLRELRVLLAYIATFKELEENNRYESCRPARIIERIGDHIERLLGGPGGFRDAPILIAAEAA